MFDIGFAELIIIGVVALLVIGPERLPGAIRTGSAWLNRFRRGFNEIKQEVQQELHNDEIMRGLKETRDQLRDETDALRNDLGKDLSKDLGNPLNPFDVLDEIDGAKDSGQARSSVEASAPESSPDSKTADSAEPKTP